MLQYFRDAREELARVTWPSRQEIIEGTQAVLLFVVALTLVVWVLDVVFGTAIKAALEWR